MLIAEVELWVGGIAGATVINLLTLFTNGTTTASNRVIFSNRVLGSTYRVGSSSGGVRITLNRCGTRRFHSINSHDPGVPFAVPLIGYPIAK